MSLQDLELNAEDRAVYKTWRRNIIVFWSTVLGVTAIVCTVLAVDSKLAPEQRIAKTLQAGMHP
jgi:hypothetical protein